MRKKDLGGTVMYERFAEWLDSVFKANAPIGGAAANFNIYEEEDGDWSVQFVTAPSFSEEDDDWCCEEVFTTGEDLYYWHRECGWEEIQDDVCAWVERYLEEGSHAGELKGYEAVAAGFVDGDLTVVRRN